MCKEMCVVIINEVVKRITKASWLLSGYEKYNEKYYECNKLTKIGLKVVERDVAVMISLQCISA